MKRIFMILLAMAIFIAVPCLAFDFPGHEGQIPLCQNNKTGALKFPKVKDIDSSEGVDYEPQCNTRFISGTTTPTETLIWVAVQGSQQSSAVKVFDSNNKFLGIFSGYSTTYDCSLMWGVDEAIIYVASLARMVPIRLDSGDVEEGSFITDGIDCTGTMYTGGKYLTSIFKYGNDYYTGDNVAPSTVQAYSGYGGIFGCGCNNSGVEPVEIPSLIPIRKITSQEIPFTLPVALPLRFE